jgi:hypothetical protein
MEGTGVSSLEGASSSHAFHITLSVTCASRRSAIAKLPRGRARFKRQVSPPSRATGQIMVYRVTTTVLAGGRLFAIYTLPTPPS